MATTDHQQGEPTKGRRLTARDCLVTTDATAADAARVTGVGGWRRRGSYGVGRVGRAMTDDVTGRRLAGLLSAAGHDAHVRPAVVSEPAGYRSVYLPDGLWATADRVLAGVGSAVPLIVTVTPGMSRNAFIDAALRALTADCAGSSGA